MTLVTQQKQQKSPTYQVLDAIRAATSQAALGQVANMSYLVATTGLCGRTVNALVYALEKQHRVVAHSYEVPRRQQIFSVLRYEPNDPRGGYGDRSSSRCHPAKAAKAATPAPSFPVFEPALQNSFSSNDEILAVGEQACQHPAMATAQAQSIHRRAELCSSTVRQRSRFHHAHPANREAHRELQAVEDFELLFTSFFTAAPVATAAGEHEHDAGIADEYIAVDETAGLRLSHRVTQLDLATCRLQLVVLNDLPHQDAQCHHLRQYRYHRAQGNPVAISTWRCRGH